MREPPDGAARPTPYELVFDAAFEARFESIRDEADARGERLTAPEGFLMLGEVGALLQDLLPEGDAAAPAAIGEYGLLLYHAYQHWRFGRPLLVLDEDAARALVAWPRPLGQWELVPWEPAGYLQLPRHLFWARLNDTAAAEPVDGIFWAVIGDEDPKLPPYRRLDLLLVLGVRRDRPGFSIAAVHETWPAGQEGHWGDASARPGGDDFANVLPGGELERLLALTTPLEALKLLSRVFWYLAEAASPEAIVRGGGGPEDTPPHHRIRAPASDG
jgi:hypothetical protein